MPESAIGYENSFVHQVTDFLEAYAKKQPGYPIFDDALDKQMVGDAVLVSAKCRRWEKV